MLVKEKKVYFWAISFIQFVCNEQWQQILPITALSVLGSDETDIAYPITLFYQANLKTD